MYHNHIGASPIKISTNQSISQSVNVYYTTTNPFESLHLRPWVGLGCVGLCPVAKFFLNVHNITVTDIRSRLSANKVEAVELVWWGCEMGWRHTSDRRKLNIYPMFTFMPRISTFSKPAFEVQRRRVGPSFWAPPLFRLTGSIVWVRTHSYILLSIHGIILFCSWTQYRLDDIPRKTGSNAEGTGHTCHRSRSVSPFIDILYLSLLDFHSRLSLSNRSHFTVHLT